ncbi:NrfD/PsrC family molybdoenzyme membrane anchor subunit [Moorella sulfitireducens]|uniref:NrfD/PsrC family molybdoenzyme membrane anchor subunit n=1 Tax=Neomoorella sulfitireducens TaxID=2972948 RepID=UPI0021AC3C6B|nr:NrfD/PsrC family molybdoenzyme membrane anchor subunit [Moorella sulfitireducens]
MEDKQAIWGRLAAGYFFCAALGAMVFAVIAFLDIISSPLDGKASGTGSFLGLAVAGLGGLLLLAELGNKKRFLLVFSRMQSIMTKGALFLACFIVLAAIYTSFWFDIFPWAGANAGRRVIGFLGIIFAVALVMYPGLELGEARGRSFWNGSALVPLWLTAALTSGLAGVILVAAVTGASIAPAIALLDKILLALIVTKVILIAAYIMGMRRAAPEEARRSVATLLSGSLKNIFWWGIVVCGHIIPCFLYFGGSGAGILAIKSLFVLAGEACLRAAFLQAGVRVSLPGEDNEWYQEEEIAVLAARLEQTWQERAAWLNGK